MLHFLINLLQNNYIHPFNIQRNINILLYMEVILRVKFFFLGIMFYCG